MFYKKNTSYELDKSLFKSPTSEYRGAPFWAWNCKMDKDMLGEQIECFKSMGFGGFHMHSRSGMAMPYLGKEFMNLVKFCTDKAKDEGMLSYLYDEDRWPSGFAGGFVTKNPLYRQKYMRFTVEKKESSSKKIAMAEGKPYLIGIYDVVLNDTGELIDYKIIDDDAVSEGRKWYAYIESQEESSRFNNQTYVDTMNKEAIEEFVKITHEKYKEVVGCEFGKTVPSIFTDEPQCEFKQPLKRALGINDVILPWTFSLEERFLKEYGYDIDSKIPELVWDLPDAEASVARYHWHNLATELFAEAFADTCGKWCEKNGIALTGHLMSEDTLRSQTMACGETMRSYRSFTIPGTDMLVNEIQFDTAKQCQSVVHQYGKEAMLTECCGVTNWDFDFRGHKFHGDWLAALGTTIRVPHLAWASMAGEGKRDYPASIGYQSPWCKEYKFIEDHFARVNTALTRGKADVRVAVIHPIESYWLNYGPEDTTRNIREKLDDRFKNILDWMLLNTIDFDYICEALLPSLINENDGGINVGKMHYDAILVPGCITLRATTVGFLEKFINYGGSVIFAGECPKYVDAVKNPSVFELYEKSTHVEFDKYSILEALESFRTVAVKNEQGCLIEDYIYAMRNDNNCKWFFLANGRDVYQASAKSKSPREDASCKKIQIEITGEYTPVLYNTLNGEIYSISYAVKNGKTIIDYTMYKGDSVLLQLNEFSSAVSTVETADKKTPNSIVRFMDKVCYKRAEPNVLLLDRAKYSLNGEPMRDEEEILRIDKYCRIRKGWTPRGNRIAQPWVIQEQPVCDYISLEFTINSECEVEGSALAIEKSDDAEIIFNGKKVSSKRSGYFVDKKIDTVALPKIDIGKNTLVVKIPFGLHTYTEWCYIIGEFNVRVEGAQTTIVPATEKIGFSNLVNQGLPFYGGNITYKTTIYTPYCDAVINVNCYRGALVKVLVDGIDRGNIVLSPYKLKIENLSEGEHTIEFLLYGTRINTFGGVHNCLIPTWVGTEYWRTEGSEWCYEYVLKKTGIFASPIVEIFQK